MNKKILLVEDELYIRELYLHVLTQEGYAVTEATDGQEALKFASEKPDLILLDIMLPKMNGIDVLKDLKAQEATKNIPIILLTNLGQESVIKESFNLGAIGYLIKVRLTPYEMVAQVKQFFENPTKKLDPGNLGVD